MPDTIDPNRIIIRGFSDDLIEIEGAIREEFNEYLSGDTTEDYRLICLSDGSAFQIRFDAEGIWRITPMALGAGTTYTKREAVDVDREKTDHVTVWNQTPYTWVSCVQPDSFHRVRK